MGGKYDFSIRAISLEASSLMEKHPDLISFQDSSHFSHPCEIVCVLTDKPIYTIMLNYPYSLSIFISRIIIKLNQCFCYFASNGDTWLLSTKEQLENP